MDWDALAAALISFALLIGTGALVSVFSTYTLWVRLPARGGPEGVVEAPSVSNRVGEAPSVSNRVGEGSGEEFPAEPVNLDRLRERRVALDRLRGEQEELRARSSLLSAGLMRPREWTRVEEWVRAHRRRA